MCVTRSVSAVGCSPSTELVLVRSQEPSVWRLPGTFRRSSFGRRVTSSCFGRTDPRLGRFSIVIGLLPKVDVREVLRDATGDEKFFEVAVDLLTLQTVADGEPVRVFVRKEDVDPHPFLKVSLRYTPKRSATKPRGIEQTITRWQRFMSDITKNPGPPSCRAGNDPGYQLPGRMVRVNAAPGPADPGQAGDRCGICRRAARRPP